MADRIRGFYRAIMDGVKHVGRCVRCLVWEVKMSPVSLSYCLSRPALVSRHTAYLIMVGKCRVGRCYPSLNETGEVL